MNRVKLVVLVVVTTILAGCVGPLAGGDSSRSFVIPSYDGDTKIELEGDIVLVAPMVVAPYDGEGIYVKNPNSGELLLYPNGEWIESFEELLESRSAMQFESMFGGAKVKKANRLPSRGRGLELTFGFVGVDQLNGQLSASVELAARLYEDRDIVSFRQFSSSFVVEVATERSVVKSIGDAITTSLIDVAKWVTSM